MVCLPNKEKAMKTLIVYDSQFGNTEQIAQRIANTLSDVGQVQMIRADPARPLSLQGVDLLIVGSPTQAWNATTAIRSMLKNTSPQRFHHLAVACFDTRFRESRWMTGSAALRLAKQLRAMRANLLLPPESFFVEAKEGPLVSWEMTRATEWALSIYQRYEAVGQQK